MNFYCLDESDNEESTKSSKKRKVAKNSCSLEMKYDSRPDLQNASSKILSKECEDHKIASGLAILRSRLHFHYKLCHANDWNEQDNEMSDDDVNIKSCFG